MGSDFYRRDFIPRRDRESSEDQVNPPRRNSLAATPRHDSERPRQAPRQNTYDHVGLSRTPITAANADNKLTPEIRSSLWHHIEQTVKRDSTASDFATLAKAVEHDLQLECGYVSTNVVKQQVVCGPETHAITIWILTGGWQGDIYQRLWPTTF